MVKHLHIYLDENDYDKLIVLKDKLKVNWHDLLLTVLDKKENK